LYRALGEERVELGANCIGYDQDADGVTAKFESGREERGRFLIGADGIRSTVRTAVAGPHELRYSGYKSWRSIATFSDPSFPPGSWWLYWGRGARFGLAHVGNGSIYWYAMVNAPARASDDPSDRWDRVLRRFQGYSHPVEALIQATPRDSIIVNDLNDVPPIATWGEGRVTLVGDAAHPTTPNMGQGACQAIEDAAVLSKQVAAVDSLGDGAAIARALRAYESNRISRAHRVTNLSWRIGSIGQWENPFAVGVRNVILRVLPNSLMRKSLESNLAFDV
jgi:2-polyprenyl-6-methoxyphenol hydroxylase-like FAD-dependent oxidoreductase